MTPEICILNRLEIDVRDFDYRS